MEYYSTFGEIWKVGQQKKIFNIRVYALFEIAFFFVVMFLISFFFGVKDQFFSLHPHPFWIIVILISAQYGTLEGVVAAIIATLIYFTGDFPPRTFIQDRFEYFFFLTRLPILWFVFAVVLGEVRRRHIQERDKLRKAALEAVERADTISKSYLSLKEIKEHLEIKLASEMKTALMAYEAFRKLEELGKDGIVEGAQNLVKTILNPEQFSIYLLKDNQLEALVLEGWDEGTLFLKSFSATSLLFQEVMGKRRVVSLLNVADRGILGSEGVLAVPIMAPKSNEVYGMIKIEKIPFLRLRTSTIESLHIIGQWVGTAYKSYLAKKEAEDNQFISAESSLLTANFLQFQSEFLINLSKRLQTNIVLMTLQLEDRNLYNPDDLIRITKKFREVVSSVLRVTDLAFEFKKYSTEFALILVHTTLEQGELVREKVSRALNQAMGDKINFTYRMTALYENGK